MRFRDRQEAGRRLAEKLLRYRGKDVVALAVPRGGVVIGCEVARALGAPIDIIVPRKLGAPDEPELAIGAVASFGDHERILDEEAIKYLHVSRDYIEQETQKQVDEIHRRLLAYRGTTQPPDVEGKTVILVDDGIATGSTLMAAVLALKRLMPEKIVLAVPVAPPDAEKRFKGLVDEFIVLATPSPFLAVGYWYEYFEQTSDEEVVRLLETCSTAARS